MSRYILILFLLSHLACIGQTSENDAKEILIEKILAEPTPQEVQEILTYHRRKELAPQEVTFHDSTLLSNGNTLYILSHKVEGNTHYGAVIVPGKGGSKKLPVVIFATGGDGIHKEFDIGLDFNHTAAQFPSYMGKGLDQQFIVAIPSFRGQRLIINDKKYQSGGKVEDAFDGATTDAIAFLNVTLLAFPRSDKSRIAIYGGSRGGTVGLLASARDPRVKRAVVACAPTGMKALYLLYPSQFSLLFFNDLFAGKITESEARRKFISSSPLYFVHALPRVQLHHDTGDPFVPVELAEKFVERMKANGKDIEPYYYNENIHGFWEDGNYWERVQEFIGALLERN